MGSETIEINLSSILEDFYMLYSSVIGYDIKQFRYFSFKYFVKDSWKSITKTGKEGEIATEDMLFRSEFTSIRMIQSPMAYQAPLR